MRKTTLSLLLLGALPIALAASLLLIGCSDSSPTSPDVGTSFGNAVVSGSVSTGATGGSSVVGASSTAGRTPDSFRGARSGGLGLGAAAGQVTPTYAADSTGAGVTVSVAGTGISTVADANGNFVLNGVPSGNRGIQFQNGSVTGTVELAGVQQFEEIEMDVTLQASGAVTVNSLERSSAADDGEEPGIDVTGLTLELAPDEWNMNYPNSSGTVEAFVRGEGIELIDLDSFEMTGDDPDANPLTARNASRQGDHVRARFGKARVLDLLLDPEPGSMHEVTVSFLEEGTDEPRLELTITVLIADDEDDDGNDDDGNDDGPGDDGGELGNLTLQLNPGNWNTNFANSNGQVQALIRGDGLDQIDLDSFTMEGDNAEAEPLEANSASRQGNNVRARFSQNQVIGLLDDPGQGSTHTVIVRFLDQDGGEHSLETEVRVNGPKR